MKRFCELRLYEDQTPIQFEDTVVWYDAQFVRIRHRVDGIEYCYSIAAKEVHSFEEWYEDEEGNHVNPPEPDNGI